MILQICCSFISITGYVCLLIMRIIIIIIIIIKKLVY